MADGPNVNVFTVAGGIETLTIIVAHSTILEGNDLPSLVIVSFNTRAPQCDIDTDVALITNRQSALFTRVSIFQVDRAFLAYFQHNSDHINCV